jgi:hypothetical protein
VAFAKFRSAEKALAAALLFGTVVTIYTGSSSLHPLPLSDLPSKLYIIPSNRSSSIKHPPRRLLPRRLPQHVHRPPIPPRRIRRPHHHAHGVHAPLVSRHHCADSDLVHACGADLRSWSAGTAIAQLVVDEAAASVGVSKTLKGWYYGTSPFRTWTYPCALTVLTLPHSPPYSVIRLGRVVAGAHRVHRPLSHRHVTERVITGGGREKSARGGPLSFSVPL